MYKAAGQYGGLHIVQFLTHRLLPHSKQADALIIGAAKGGHVHILEWMFRDRNFKPPKWKDLCISSALNASQFHVVKWCIETGSTLDQSIFQKAISGGNMDAINFCFTCQCPCDIQQCMLIAAINGRLDILKLCIDNGGKLSNAILLYANIHGYLDIIAFCRNQGL